MNYYTGVGSRNTPRNILNLMTAIAQKMQSLDFILRSGGAKGADTAFENGAGIKKCIFYAKDATYEAEQIAAQFHHAWNRCSAYAKKLHGRNAFQVLGGDLATPSQYCICWTPDGCVSHATRSIQTGGTGTAISIADHYGIPVVNLCIPAHFNIWANWVNS